MSYINMRARDTRAVKGEEPKHIFEKTNAKTTEGVTFQTNGRALLFKMPGRFHE
jgi:hypothetical protein